MGWWKSLKVWQKAGIIVGGAHFILYFTLLALAPPILAYLSLVLERPWWWFFKMIGFEIAGALGFIVLGIIGTLFYMVSASVLVWAISLLKQKS